jgi:hypothetical protein
MDLNSYKYPILIIKSILYLKNTIILVIDRIITPVLNLLISRIVK